LGFPTLRSLRGPGCVSGCLGGISKFLGNVAPDGLVVNLVPPLSVQSLQVAATIFCPLSLDVSRDLRLLAGFSIRVGPSASLANGNQNLIATVVGVTALTALEVSGGDFASMDELQQGVSLRIESRVR